MTDARPTATTCRDRPLRHEPARGKLSGKSLEGEKIAISARPGHSPPPMATGPAPDHPGPCDLRSAENTPGSGKRCPVGRPSEQSTRLGPETGWRERGPPCPPAGHSSEDPRTDGQRTTRGRPSPHLRWASNRAHRPPGARSRVAGGRTSVSAPMDIHPKTPAPMGREQPWTGTAPHQLPAVQPNRANGPGVLPARSIGPGTTPNDMSRPNRLKIPLMTRAVPRTAGPLGRTTARSG